MSKINWGKIKQDYFDSEIIEVRDFMRSSCGLVAVAERTIDNRTKGWRIEKEELSKEKNKRITEKVLADTVSNADLTTSQATLLKIKKLAINSIGKRISDNNATLTMNELVNGLNAIKTELGETTNVSTLNSNITTVINSNRIRPENEK